MTTTHRPTALVLVALGLSALAGCGANQAATTSSAATTAATAPSSSQAAPAGQGAPATAEATRTVTATASPAHRSTRAADTTATDAPASQAAGTPADGLDGDGDGLYGPDHRIGATVTKREDIDVALQDTSRSFVTFATDLFDKGAAGCKEQTSITVDHWFPNGLATGGFTSCGGYNALWFQKDGVWKEYGYQAVPMCDDVRAAGIPRAIPAETGFRCLEEGSNKPVAYSPSKG